MTTVKSTVGMGNSFPPVMELELSGAETLTVTSVPRGAFSAGLGETVMTASLIPAPASISRPRVRASASEPPSVVAMRATSYNLAVAKLMGINTDRVIAFTFALGSALAAVGGVLVALAIPRIDPLMGLMTGLKAFVAAVLGGIGNIPGAMIGGMLIGLMETAISAIAYSTYRDAIAFAVFILILLIRPAGIMGSARSFSTMLVTTKHGTVLVPANFPRRESKDNQMHACMRVLPGSNSMRLICLFLPPST